MRLARRGRPVRARTGVRPVRDDGCGADAGGVLRGHPERRPETGTVDALGPQAALLPRALRVDEVAPHHGWALRHPLVLGGRSAHGPRPRTPPPPVLSAAPAHHQLRPDTVERTGTGPESSACVPTPAGKDRRQTPQRVAAAGRDARCTRSCRTQATVPRTVARGALTASRRSRTCRRVWQRCPGGVHRAATQRSTSTPPGPDRVVGGRTGLSPRPWSRSGVHLRGPATRGVGDGGRTRRSPSAPTPVVTLPGRAGVRMSPPDPFRRVAADVGRPARRRSVARAPLVVHGSTPRRGEARQVVGIRRSSAPRA